MNDPRLKRHELGFLTVADLPSDDELKQYYADRYYQTERGNYRKQYSTQERAFFDAKIAQLAQIVDGLRPGSAPGNLLDVGCGEGFALRWFQAAGWNVEGLDFSDAGVRQVNPTLAEHVVCGNVFELLDERAKSGRSYDLLWLTNVLEHVRDPLALLETLRGLVSGQGVLVVTVPNDGSRFQETLLAEGLIPGRFWVALPDHLSYFTADSLRRTAGATGWDCGDLVADFPIDWFLANRKSNYVQSPECGPDAHQARLLLEALLAEQPTAGANDFFRALAGLGFGRNLTAFLTPAAR